MAAPAFGGDSDSDEELFYPWEERATIDGKVYYVNHETKQTQWDHPSSGKRKQIAGELPYGWEREVDDEGRVFYVDHLHERTTYTDPRLAFAQELRGAKSKRTFDASSTGMHVLMGRNLSSKVAIVTGASSGIGFETARSLAHHGCEVIMACRNPKKTEEAVAMIKKERPEAKVIFMYLNLESFESVQGFIAEFKAQYQKLHFLILNAGVFAIPYGRTVDGFERIFQINYLSQFLLATGLVDVMLNTAPARMIMVSSESHRMSFLTKDNLSRQKLSPESGDSFWPIVAYNDSKMCNILFAKEFNRRYSAEGVLGYCVHPGNMINTSLARHSWLYRMLFWIVKPFTKNAQQGAATTIFATTTRIHSGGTYFNNCQQCMPSAAADDEEFAAMLWKLSEEMISR